jgi:CBS domain-containing protein
MLDKNIGSLAVLEGNSLVGIFTERGHCRDVTLKGKFAKRTRVQEVMAQELVCVGLHTTVEECMTLMTYKRIRHLPVLDDARLVGIVSIGDVVKAAISDEKFTIDQLEKYITSMP